MSIMSYRHMFVLVFMFILIVPTGFSLKVFPTLTELADNYKEEQSFILTILNDGARTEDINLVIDDDSFYLKDYVRIEPSKFTLKSNTKQNVQITLSFPDNLSPERHRLVLVPKSSQSIGEKTVYTFTVPGIARPDLRIDRIDVKEINEGMFAFTLVLDNKGNVIGRANPLIEIYNGSKKIAEMNYPSNIMVMPFSLYNITILYDTSSLPDGKYNAVSVFYYNDNLRTNEVASDFLINIKGEYNNTFSFLSKIV
jgi:hypothetical protein